MDLSELAEKLLLSQTGHDVVSALSDEMLKVGGEQILYGTFRATGAQGMEDVLHSSYDPLWLGEYVEQGLFETDPAAQGAVLSPRPFAWSTMENLSAAEARTMERCAVDGGLVGGVSISLNGPAGVRAAMSIATTGKDAALEHHVAEVGAAATLANHAMWTLQREHKGGVALTPRQIEVLNWTGAGKTMREVGDILAIDARTVEFHLAGAQARLGGTSKFHTVWLALQAGLISLDLQDLKFQ